MDLSRFPKLSKKSLKPAFLIALFASVGLASLYLLFTPRPLKVESASARVGTFQEVIEADGVLRSKERYTVPAFADGDIRRVPLKVGEQVKKGDTITELFWDVKYEPVKAPIDGVVSKVYREAAGPVRRGDPLVELIDPRQLELSAELLTTDAMRLEKGAAVSVKNWSGKRPVHGRVSRISKAGFVKPSALGVEEERTEVTAELTEVPPDFFERAGSTFHVDLAFRVSETKNALLIPVGALFREGQAWAVYVIDHGQARKRTVGLSGMNSKDAAIRSGLTEGERVIVYPGDLVKEQTRIEVERHD